MWMPELDEVSLVGIKGFKPCFAVRKNHDCVMWGTKGHFEQEMIAY